MIADVRVLENPCFYIWQGIGTLYVMKYRVRCIFFYLISFRNVFREVKKKPHRHKEGLQTINQLKTMFIPLDNQKGQKHHFLQ